MKRIFAALLLTLPSCGLLPRSTPTPVPTLAAGQTKGSELIVFLPGRWSKVSEFEQEGFFEIARKHWPEARLVAADLHIGYYKNQSMARRLHEDVILPARRSGVKNVRLVGVSMGGLGALIYDAEYPGQADELILLSPFVGEDEALREIEASGDLMKWRPAPPAARDFSRKLWLELREKRLVKGDATKVLLGCGTEDKLAASNRLFAKEFLKLDEQLWIPGDHDWPTWRPLFEKLIQ